jgi:hypothetical protein
MLLLDFKGQISKLRNTNTVCPGSGMEKNQDPDLRSGINIIDPFSESLETVLGLKILKFFYAVSDPGWKNSNPGSATLNIF